MKLTYLLVALFTEHLAMATTHVNMFAKPDTFHVTGQGTFIYHIDVNNDGLNDISINYENTIYTTTTFGQTENAYGWEMEAGYSGNVYYSVAYLCGATMGAGSTWAQSVNFNYFNGKGPRYMAVKKEGPYNGNYYFGWVKMEYDSSAGYFVIYGVGYEDVTALEPTIVAGYGECISTGIAEQASQGVLVRAYNGQLQVTGTDTAAINVFDVTGRLITGFHYRGGGDTYNLQNLVAGCYLVETVSAKSRKTVKVVL